MFKVSIDTSGLDKLQKKIQDVSGSHPVKLKDLFNKEFMQVHTKFEEIGDFFDKGGFNFKNEEEFKAIDEDKLDKWVKDNSEFESWSGMLKAAGAEHIKKQLDF